MSTRAVLSSLWLVAGVIGIIAALAYRVEPVTWAITIALGIPAVLVGSALLRRAVPSVPRWSVALGIAWVSCYVALAVWQRGDPAALATDVGLALFGAAAVVVGAGQRPHRRESRPVPPAHGGNVVDGWLIFFRIVHVESAMT